MNIEEYQDNIKQFAIYPGANTANFQEVIYLSLGLTSEAGEVAGKVKKFIRDGMLDEEKFLHELGDVLWYLTMLASACNITIPELAKMNYDKLSERKASGTIKGNGDVRIAVPSKELIIP